MAASTMLTAKINEAGTQLAYIDSGPPSEGSDTYTTVICVHGVTYHAQNFSRLLPLAKKYNLRIIAVNRRDYVGSTLFTPAELEAINNDSEDDHIEFLRARGLELARFLIWVIREKKIPKSSADGREGGFALLGWSLGNVTTMAFLRHLGTFPKDVVETIEPYLRTLFIYEAGSGGFGFPTPEGGYHPLSDKTVPVRMRGIMFGTWVSSYFTHPFVSSSSSSRTLSSLQIHTPPSGTQTRTCTMETLTPTELAACVDPLPGPRSEQAYWGVVDADTMHDQTQGALLLDHQSTLTQEGKGRSGVLREMKVCVVYGTATVWSVIWGAWELEKEVGKWAAEGRDARPIRFLPIESTNHFFHWDDAEQFLRVVADGIRS